MVRRDLLSQLRYNMADHPGPWCARLVFLLGPWLSLWMVELLNGNDVFTDLYAWQVTMNLVWYYILFVALRLVLGRMKWASWAGAGLAFALGLVNHYVLRFRGRILFPADIAGWHTAANVAEAFDFSPDLEIRQSAILLVAYLALATFCPGQKKRARLPRPASVALAGAILVYSFAFFKTDMLPALGIYTQQWVTQRNGFVLNFTVALRYSSIEKPEDYSRQRVLELMEQYPGTAGDQAKQPANLIVIMNESLADMTIFEELEPSEDPTPFLRELKENTVKGWMYTPVTGGGTATVEFEYLTGLSSMFQPPHTVAYQLYMEENMPSLAAIAGEEGYATTAFHPYLSSGWNRPIAYECLSFDRQLYDEDVEDPYLIRKYISDKSSYDTVIRTAQVDRGEGNKSFVFNVTMQNHSSYAQGWNNLERTIDLPAELKGKDSSARQYFALAKVSDDALRELIHHYAQSEEPTMVVMFGDHQPPLRNEFYEALYGKPLAERTTQEVMKQYQVPFFLWANYDIQEQEDVIVSPNYLGAMTAQLAGLPLSGFMEFLLEMHQHLPALTPVGICTEEGEFLKEEELDQEEQQWLENYEILNYCGVMDLFDEAREMFCPAK